MGPGGEYAQTHAGQPACNAMARLVTTPTASHTARAAAVYAQAIEGGASVRYLPVAVADYDLASSTPEIKGGSGNKG